MVLDAEIVTPLQRNPIGDVDVIDVVGVRKDGGPDLVMSVSGPIDDSPTTLSLLEAKIRNYLKSAESESFLAHYGVDAGAPKRIFISCAYPIARSALELIQALRTSAAKRGIQLEVRRHMGDVH